MIVLDDGHFIGEAEGDGQLHLVLRLIRPVPAPPLGLPKYRLGEGILSGQLGDIVQNPVFVLKLRGGKLAGGGLLLEAEGDTGVNHRLPLEYIGVVLHRDVNVGKDLQVGLPPDRGPRLFPPIRGLLFQAANIFSFFKMEGIL